MGAPSEVCRVSILGSWSLAATLPGDVDRPESQEVLVSREVCLQFGIGCLSGADCPLPALAALACLSPVGDGPVCSQLAPLRPLFCERAWPCLRLGLFFPQSGLLSQARSLRLPPGHSALVLTLRNAACSSQSLPRLSVGDASVWAAAPLGVAVRHIICGV